MTLKYADEVNALTNYLVNNLRKAGFTRDNIRIIPWGIDTQMFSFRERKLQSPVRFLHIGNLHPVKDGGQLFEAGFFVGGSIEIVGKLFCKELLILWILECVVKLNLLEAGEQVRRRLNAPRPLANSGIVARA